MHSYFYVLERASRPGRYYIKDSDQTFITNNIMLAERYPSKEKALECWAVPSEWRVCKVTIDIEYV